MRPEFPQRRAGAGALLAAVATPPGRAQGRRGPSDHGAPAGRGGEWLLEPVSPFKQKPGRVWEKNTPTALPGSLAPGNRDSPGSRTKWTCAVRGQPWPLAVAISTWP